MLHKTITAYLRQHKLPRDVCTLPNFRYWIYVLRQVFWTVLSLSPLILWELRHPDSPLPSPGSPASHKSKLAQNIGIIMLQKLHSLELQQQGLLQGEKSSSISSPDGPAPVGGMTGASGGLPINQHCCLHPCALCVLIWNDSFDINSHAWASSVFQGNGKGTHLARIVTSKMCRMQ